MESSADEDGWIYGSAPSEIAEIALGRKSSGNKGFLDGGITSSASSSTQRSIVSSGSCSATGRTATGGSGTSAVPLRTNEVGVEAQQQQQQQPDALVSGLAATESGVMPTPSADDKGTSDTEEDPQRREKEGVEREVDGAGTGRVGVGRETDAAAGAGGGGSTDAGGSWTSWLRRRRLVRLRMVGRVDGARESTSGVVALIRR